MSKCLRIAFAFVALCGASAHADVTLTYELSAAGGEKSTRKFSIARFFVRVDDPAQPDTYHLYQAGKFFPLYRVDRSRGTYTLLTPEVEPTLHAGGKRPPAVGRTESRQPMAKGAPPSAREATARPDGAQAERTKSAAPDVKDAPSVQVEKAAKSESALRPTTKSRTVAGVRCRVVEELIGDQAIMEHCMANKARLGIREREIRTLARLFVLARDQGFGWLGTATKDEDFVSVQSRDLRSNAKLELKALSLNFLPQGYLQVPGDYRKVPLDAAVKSKPESAAKNAAESAP